MFKGCTSYRSPSPLALLAAVAILLQSCRGSAIDLTTLGPSPKATPSPPSSPTSPPASLARSQSYKGWIAFAAEQNGVNGLYIIDPSSLEIRPLAIGDAPLGFPSWSPDYTRLAFVAEDHDVFVVDPACYDRSDCDTSLERYTQPNRVHSTLAWLPGQNTVLLSTIPREDGAVPHLMTLPLNPGGIAQDLGEAGFNAKMSPDGASILFDAYTGADQLMLSDLSAGATFPLLSPTSELANSIYGDWSPDGSRIAFMTTPGEGLSYGVQYDIYVAQADGTDPYLVATNGWWPDWSPDGVSIVFEREEALYTVDVLQGIERKILALPKSHNTVVPAWSP